MMTRKLYLLFMMCLFAVTPQITVADSMDFEEFAVVDSTDADITMEEVNLNSDADIANVSSFDIAGILLGMGFDDVYTQFKDKGLYTTRKKNSIIYTIHPDWKYNLDYECRMQGTVIPEQLNNCINSLARSRGLLYASELHLVRENTGETIVVYFTSNATDNRVWHIVYNNDVNELDGDSEKFENQREKKILAFLHICNHSFYIIQFHILNLLIFVQALLYLQFLS